MRLSAVPLLSLSAWLAAADPTVTLSSGSTGLDERLPLVPAVLTIARSGTTAAELTVQLRATGSASATGSSLPDWRLVSTSATIGAVTFSAEIATIPVTIPSGAATAAVQVLPLWDWRIEGTESASFTIGSDPAYTVGSPAGTTLTIVDGTPTVTLEAIGGVCEAAPGSTAALVVRLDAAIPADLAVELAFTGTAALGSDVVNPGTVVLVPGGFTAATVSISVLNDALRESDETLIATLAGSNPVQENGRAYRFGTPASAAITVINDDGPIQDVITVSGDATINERIGATAADIVLRRSATAAGDLVVGWTLVDAAQVLVGGAPAAASGTTAFPASATTIAIPVAGRPDLVVEPATPVVFTLTGVSSADAVLGSPVQATITVTDGSPALTLAVSGTAGETTGTPAILTVAYAGPASPFDHPFTIAYTALPSPVSNGSGTWAAAVGGAIAAGSTSATIAVTALADGLAHPGWSLRTVLSPGAGSTGSGTVAVAVVDDAPVVTVAPVADADEDGTPGGFRVALAPPAGPGGVVLRFAVTGSAGAGTDYVALAATRSVAAGATEALIPVVPLTDALPDDGETVILTVLTDSVDPTYTTGATAAATIRIRDRIPGLWIEPAVLGIQEGATGTGFRVVRSTTGGALAVSVAIVGTGATAAGTADIAALAATVTIAAGASAAPIVVTGTDDRLPEVDERLTLGISAPATAAIVVAATAAITIVERPAEAGITIVESGREGATVAFTIELGEARSVAAALPWTLSGSADPALDLSAASSNGTVTFATGATEARVVFTLVDDLLAESEEQLVLTIGATTGIRIGGSASAAARIIDATPEVTVRRLADGAEPALPARFRIAYSGTALSRPATVGVIATGSAVAIQPVPATQVIPAGSTGIDLLVVPVDNTTVATGARIVVEVRTVDGSARAAGTAGAAVLDDDPRTFALANEPDAVVVAAGNVWSHRILVVGSPHTATGALTASLAAPPGGTAPPSWLGIAAPVRGGDGTVTVDLSGTAAGAGPVRVRVLITHDPDGDGDADGTLAVDLILVVVPATTGGG
jgi:hypothetical protein